MPTVLSPGSFEEASFGIKTTGYVAAQNCPINHSLHVVYIVFYRLKLSAYFSTMPAPDSAVD